MSLENLSSLRRIVNVNAGSDAVKGMTIKQGPRMFARENDERVSLIEVYVVGAGWRNYVFMRIETRSGIEEWGEAPLGWKESAVASLLKELGARYLVGEDAFAIERLWFSIYLRHGSTCSPMVGSPVYRDNPSMVFKAA